MRKLKLFIIIICITVIGIFCLLEKMHQLLFEVNSFENMDPSILLVSFSITKFSTIEC